LRQELSELRSILQQFGLNTRDSQAELDSSSPIQVVGRDAGTLEDAVRRATPYSVVEVPEGNHRFETLHVDKPITIRKCATARKLMTKLMGTLILDARGAKVERVCLHRDEDSHFTQTVIIGDLLGGRFDRESDITISNCDLTIGIQVNGRVPTIIRHCVFHECKLPGTLPWCISLGNDSNAQVQSCLLQDIPDAIAINIHGNAEGYFSSNVIHGSWEQPAFYQNNTGWCTIEENNVILCPVWLAASEGQQMRRTRGSRRHR